MSTLLMVKAMNLKVGNPLRKLVLIKLADNANDAGECWPSYQHIADQCEISKRSVMRHVDDLCSAGLLTKEERLGGPKGQKSNLYFLKLDSDAKSLVTESHLGGDRESPVTSDTKSPRTSHSSEPVIEPVNKTDLVANAPAGVAESKHADDVQAVFEHWKTVMAKPRAKLDDARRRLIQRAMKGGYTVDDLKKAIDGCRASPFHMGDNTQRTKYNGLDLILRNSEKIDGFMEKAGAGRPRSAHTGFQPEDYQGMEYVSEGAEEWLRGSDGQ